MEMHMKKISSLFVWFVLVGFVLTMALVLNVSPASAQVKKPLVDLNSASEKELEALPGVGPATSKKIVANRPYKSVDELSKAGLSAKTIETLKPVVTVGSTTPPKESASKTPAPTAPAKAASTTTAPSSVKKSPPPSTKLA
ncbi:MAG TPA: helix-hairpin-helix domain-containing protein, partial [Thermodesulfobacteriota bacterium]|nr:helix-hairpin-helix domain-containing protein [Thermodesulfobacteriota bacterium]